MDQALFFQEPRSYNLQHKTCHSETSYFTLECGARRKVQIADESDHRSYEECLSTRGGRNKCFRSFFSCSPKKYLLLKAMPLDFPPFPRNGKEICFFFSTSLSIPLQFHCMERRESENGKKPKSSTSGCHLL